MDLSRFTLVSLRPVEGESYLEAGGAGLGFDGDEARVLVDDALHGVQAKSQPAPGSFGGEERLEDAGANLGVDSRAVVPNLDQRHGAVEMGGETKGPHVVHAFQSVFDQGGPNLIELAAVGADGWKLGVEIKFYGDVLQPGVEHNQRVFQGLGKVDVLNGRLVHVGVVLDGADEVEDADGRVDDCFGQALDAQGAGDGREGNR